MASKVFTGGRARVFVDQQLVGIFDSVSYGINIGTEAIHILGRYSPTEITQTSYEAVTIDCSGFRVVDQGPHVLPKVPKLQDLINIEGVTVAVEDRQTGKIVMTALGCIPTRYNTGANSRATSKVQVTYLGLRLSDESGDQDEAGATNLP